jgi:ribosomal protein S18 acetylase RimI-like enzyme
MQDLVFRHYDADGARAIRSIVATIHHDAYADAIASGRPFAAPEAFMSRFDAHTTRPSFDLVLAYAGDEPVGQAWGWPEDDPDAYPASTFSVAEIMVRHEWTGQGIAHALHDELLSARTERQAELYVRPENEIAYRAYRRWGWRKVGQVKPDLPDAPQFDVLVLPLPITR